MAKPRLISFINDWLTMDIGYFLAPIGFWNERLDPQWINKLPDEPLVLRQVIPNGLALTGLAVSRGQVPVRVSPENGILRLCDQRHGSARNGTSFRLV